MEIYRQGDVLLVRCQLPKEAKDNTPPDRIVLAYGEVTGHAHAIASDQARLYSVQAERFIRVATRAFLRHDEHDTIELPRGTYRVVQQREYTPEAIRNVAD